MSKRTLTEKGGRLFRATIIPITVLVVWQAFSSAHILSPIILPGPLAVIQKWWAYLLPPLPRNPLTDSWLSWALSGELPLDAFASFQRVVVGFLIGAGLALPLGLLMGANDKIYRLFNPLIEVLRPIPPIAYIPLAILWFGLGNPPAYFLISIGAFFPVLLNTIAGVRHVDGIYIRAARNLGVSQYQMFVRVILPAATPYILSGARIGMGTAFIVVIVAEMIAVNSGLGFRILEAREYFWSDKIIAGMFTIGFLGLAIDTVMTRINNHLLRWHRGIDA
ncbi:ABC transporter permease [[Pseudomonas] carboxydohydrogena]|uniref:ABC transporter permease n=1 Tax=Afipia carboxydohydrogena TaxID=290 RepID=A0ABY8BV34_AFICR|nr:ABC transporter permease [[Pseudomonas] carboxydohydrogena]WEF52172.1 ABC transporter permease [[Pseudomonas] carboxydohydrogena]